MVPKDPILALIMLVLVFFGATFFAPWLLGSILVWIGYFEHPKDRPDLMNIYYDGRWQKNPYYVDENGNQPYRGCRDPRFDPPLGYFHIKIGEYSYKPLPDKTLNWIDPRKEKERKEREEQLKLMEQQRAESEKYWKEEEMKRMREVRKFLNLENDPEFSDEKLTFEKYREMCDLLWEQGYIYCGGGYFEKLLNEPDLPPEDSNIPQ